MRAIDRIIEVKVRGGHLTKDNRNAGTQHEANVTFLRIDFDEGWDSYAKKVTFWDALMGNPVKQVLTTDKLEDVTASTRVYLIPIPGEAMGEAGDLTFIVDGYYVEPFFGYREYLTLSAQYDDVDEYTIGIEDVLNEEEQDALLGRQISLDGNVYTVVSVGYKGDSEHTILTLGEVPVGAEEGKLIYPADGKRKRSLADTLWVKPAPIEEDAAEPTDPTPTQAEQLQVQIDHIKDDIQDAEKAATTAQAAADFVEARAQEVYDYHKDVSLSLLAARGERMAAEDAAAAASGYRDEAQAAAEAAEQNKVDSEACQQAAEAAHAAADEANASAAASAAAAAASEANAQTYSASAYENAVIAKNARDAAATSASTAESAASIAQANANATMNFASDAAASADAAQAAADAAAAAVSGGTVAEAIAAHNTSTTAHSDIRTELSAVARAKTGGEIDQRLQNRVEKSGDAMTGILTFDTPSLFSAFQKKRTIGDVNYLMRAGIGNDGNGASVCLRLFSVADDGTETVVSHIEADSTGVYWVAPGGVRKTIAHSGNLGVLTASVE